MLQALTAILDGNLIRDTTLPLPPKKKAKRNKAKQYKKQNKKNKQQQQQKQHLIKRLTINRKELINLLIKDP